MSLKEFSIDLMAGINSSLRQSNNRQLEILDEARAREAALKAKYEAKLKRAAKLVAELKKNQKTDSFLIPPSFCKDIAEAFRGFNQSLSRIKFDPSTRSFKLKNPPEPIENFYDEATERARERRMKSNLRRPHLLPTEAKEREENRRFHREAWNISNKSANDNIDHP